MPREIGPGRRPVSPAALIAAGVILLALLLGARTIASYAIEVAWWKELGQFHTWLSMLYYSVAPLAAATLVAFVALWIAHARALKFAGTRLGEHRLYARLSTLALLVLGYLIAAVSIDTWTVVRFAGSRGLPAARHRLARRRFRQAALLLSVRPAVLRHAARLRAGAGDLLHSALLDGGARLAIALPASGAARRRARSTPASSGWKAAWNRASCAAPRWCCCWPWRCASYLGRYEMVYNEHGIVPGGHRLRGPERRAAAAMAADRGLRSPPRCCVWLGRWILAACMALALVVAFAVPRVGARALYVRPNEISLERPYIQTHIHATRSAFGLEQHVHEMEFKAQPDAPIDIAAAQATARQRAAVGLHAPFTTPSPRSRRCAPITSSTTATWTATPSTASTARCCWRRASSISASLPDARANWINPAFIYTHGYGLVLAEVSQITPDGLPVLLIEDAPPRSQDAQPEADAAGDLLRRGDPRAGVRQHRAGGVQLSFRRRQRATRATRARAASPSPRSACGWPPRIDEGEPNILLTDYLTANSRMMIRRKVRDRLQELAGFLAMGPRSVPGDHRRRPPGVDGGRLHHLRRASLFARAWTCRTWAASTTSATRSRPPWTPTTARRTCTSSRPTTRSSAPTSISSPTCSCPASEMPADLRAPRALSGDAVPRAGRDLPHLPHARPAVVLQQGGPVGPGAPRRRPGATAPSR